MLLFALFFAVVFFFFIPLLGKCAVKHAVLKNADRDVTRDTHGFSKLSLQGAVNTVVKIVLSHRCGCESAC